MHFDVSLAQSMFLRNGGDDKSVRLYLQHLGMGMPTRHEHRDGYMQCTFFSFSFKPRPNIVPCKCSFISVNAVRVCAACVKTIPENQRPAGEGGGGGEGKGARKRWK